MLVKLFSRCNAESIMEFTLVSAAATCAWMNILDLPICTARRSVGVGDLGLVLVKGVGGVVGEFCSVEGVDGRTSSSS